jgi:hypothetical protein
LRNPALSPLPPHTAQREAVPSLRPP